MSRRKAVVFLLIAAVLWSTGGPVIKLVGEPPLALAGLRSIVSAVFLLAATGRLSPRRFPRLSPIRAFTALAYAGVTILFVTSTRMTTAANAILLQYTAPVFVALFSYGFLGERITAVDWLTILAVLGGLFLFFLDELNPAGFWGNLIAILAGVCFAWVALLTRRQKDGSPVEPLILGNILAALLCLPFALRAAPAPLDWLGILYLGVFQLGLAYLLYAAAVRHLKAVEIVLIPVIEPILNPLWVFLVVGERPTPWAIAGGLVVLAAVTVRGMAAARPARETAA